MERPVIFKRHDGLTSQEVVDACLFREPDDLDKECLQRSMEDFIRAVESSCFTDYDGFGRLVIDGKVVANSATDLSRKSVCVGDELIVPLGVLSGLFGDRANITWFNR